MSKFSKSVFIISILLIPAISIACEDKIVTLSNLQPHWLIKTNFNGQEVWVYKRSSHQIKLSKQSKDLGFDQHSPSWWDHNKNPIDFEVSQSATRSISDDYFVFYSYSPVMGYQLMFSSEKHLKKGQYPYLASSWAGGFVDVVNQIGFDFTGRPISVNLPQGATQRDVALSKLNLLVPSYTYNKKTNSITILCKEKA